MKIRMVAAVLFVCVLLAVYAGIRYVHSLVDEYTDTKPLPAPAVQLSDAEIKILQDRLQVFNKAMKENKPVEPLVLTAEEINALIANQTRSNSPTPVRLYFSFNEDRVQAQLSVPADGLGLKMLRGRYFNGSGDFRFQVTLVDNGNMIIAGNRRTQIDMRFAKILRFAGRRLDVGLDLQNLLNTNYGTVFEQQYDYTAPNGGTWLNPTTILGPRFARLNLTFNF
jgi:hypothetical protein